MLKRRLLLLLPVLLSLALPGRGVARRFRPNAKSKAFAAICRLLGDPRPESVQALRQQLGTQVRIEAITCEQGPLLHAALLAGASDAQLEVILQAGVNVDRLSISGDSALHVAVKNDNLSALRLLTTKQANQHIKNRSGQTPLQLAKALGRTDMLADLGESEIYWPEGAEETGEPEPKLAPLPEHRSASAAQFHVASGDKAQKSTRRHSSPRRPPATQAPSIRVPTGVIFWILGIFAALAIPGLWMSQPVWKPVLWRLTNPQKKAKTYRQRLVVGGQHSDGAKLDSETLRLLISRGFSVARFCARVRGAFELYQSALSLHVAARVRTFVSDGVYERLLLQIEDQNRQGFRLEVGDVFLESVRLALVESDDLFDTVHVAIKGSATYQRCSLSTGASLDPRARPEIFHEIWSLVRRRKVKELQGDQGGSLEGCCPSCGAAVGDQGGICCPFCQARLLDARHDWLLTEITQRSEWTNTRSDEVGLVQSLRRQDPSFNLQHVEDRAAVIFWRKLRADQRGQVDLIRRVADPSYLAEYQKFLDLLASRPEGRVYYTDCQIGAVNTLGLIRRPDQIQALVELRWSGRRMAVKPGAGADQAAHERPSFMKELLLLGRQPEVRSRDDLALASSQCPSCGAPEDGGSSGQCEHCGTVLNDGSRDWVLLATPTWESPEAKDLLQQVRQEQAKEQLMLSNERLFAWMLAALVKDDMLNEGRLFVSKLGTRLAIDRQLMRDLASQAIEGRLAPVRPAHQRQASAWLTEIVIQAGPLFASTPRLAAWVLDLARAQGYTHIDVKGMITRGIGDNDQGAAVAAQIDKHARARPA